MLCFSSHHVKKRGQASATSAATLVALVAGLILLYVLFLPPADRAKLLGENITNTSNGGTTPEESGSVTLLVVQPGRLDVTKEPEQHTLPTVNLFESTNSKELEKFNSFYVRNGWFDKKTQVASFTLEDLQNTDNVFLSFKAMKHRGLLTITLNGAIIFENEIIGTDPEPVVLKKDQLKKDNQLEFSVSSVGWRFWATNEYSFQNMKIIGDVTDISRQKSQNTFTIKDFEYYNLAQAVLKFLPNCNEHYVGNLDVFVNREKVFSAIPECGVPNQQDIAPGSLYPGSNSVIFVSSKGNYLIENIEVKIDLKEHRFATYFFEINDTQYQKIQDGKDLVLSMKFVDDKEDKQAKININGHITNVMQSTATYSKTIPKYWIENGNNYVEIEPLTTLNIVELRIKLNE